MPERAKQNTHVYPVRAIQIGKRQIQRYVSAFWPGKPLLDCVSSIKRVIEGFPSALKI